MQQSRPKLLHIITGLQIGGAEAMLIDLIAGLEDQFDQELIYFHHGPHADRLKELGIPAHHVKGFFTAYDPLFLYRLHKLVQAINPKVIHTSLWSAGWLGRLMAKRFNIPVVCAVHSLVGMDGKIRDWLDQQNVDAAAKFVAVSESVAHSIYKQRWMPANKIVIIRNGIDTAEILSRADRKRKTRQALGIPEDAFIIGAVGRFIESKRYDLLLEVVATLARNGPSDRAGVGQRERGSLPKVSNQSIHLLLVGHGPEEQKLRKLANDLSLQVHFIKDFPAYGYYPIFDCFALPSVREGLSMALLEAMSCGLPSIVTGYKNQHEVIRHNSTGIVIAPDDSEALSRGIKQLIENPTVRASMGAAAANYVRIELSQSRMVRDYAQIFKSCL